MIYYGHNDFRNYYLAHHGILGQKWGKKNGPPYPLGSGDHSASEKKAGWRKSLGGGRNESEYGKKPKTVDKSPKKGIQLTDKQKKAIKIGAIATGVTLAAVGTVYLAKTGKLQRIGSAFMAGSDGSPIAASADNTQFLKDAVNNGYRLKEHNPVGNERTINYIKSELGVINPSGSNINCPAVSACCDLRARGLDMAAKAKTVTQMDMELVYPGYKKTALGSKSSVFSAYKAFESQAKAMGEGARGEIHIGYSKEAIALWKKRGGKLDLGMDLEEFGHSYPFEVKNGKVLLLNAQTDPPRIYSGPQKILSALLWNKDRFSISRLDDLVPDVDWLRLVGENRV